MAKVKALAVSPLMTATPMSDWQDLLLVLQDIEVYSHPGLLLTVTERDCGEVGKGERSVARSCNA